MNSFKRLILILVFNYYFCNTANVEDEIIPNASYLVYEDAGKYSCSSASSYVTFYTFDGELLQRLEHNFDFRAMQRKLDKSAPLPRPTKYYIKFMSNICFSMSSNQNNYGYYIVFLDKNGNKIKDYRYNEKEGLRPYTSLLDLSIVEQLKDVPKNPPLSENFIGRCVIS